MRHGKSGSRADAGGGERRDPRLRRYERPRARGTDLVPIRRRGVPHLDGARLAKAQERRSQPGRHARDRPARPAVPGRDGARESDN